MYRKLSKNALRRLSKIILEHTGLGRHFVESNKIGLSSWYSVSTANEIVQATYTQFSHLIVCCCEKQHFSLIMIINYQVALKLFVVSKVSDIWASSADSAC